MTQQEIAKATMEDTIKDTVQDTAEETIQDIIADPAGHTVQVTAYDKM